MSSSSSALKPIPVTPAVSTVIPLPKDVSAEHMRNGLKLQQAGKFAGALKAYDEVLRRHPKKLAAVVNKAAALRSLGKAADAMAWFLRALSISPDNVEIWSNMGNTLLDLGRTEEAEEALKTALSKAPNVAQVWVSLARLLLSHKRIAATEAVMKRALALRPNDVSIRLELATLWHEQGQSRAQVQRALEEFQALEQVAPNHPRVLCGLGQALIGVGRLEEAEEYLKKTLSLVPDHLDAHLGLARLYLLNRDFEQGWEKYEWRRHRTDKKKPEVPGIEWDGSDPQGKTILVYAEQGFGDTIQFLRFITPLAKRGANVIVVCQKSMVSLVQQVEGVTKATCLWRPLTKYDFFTPLLSLPHKLQLGADGGLPGNVPYISTTRKAQLPTAPLGTRLKVGLVWAGSATNPDDHNRSTGLEALLPLTGVSGAQFYSLQVGPRAADIIKVAHPSLITDFSKHLKEYADTAAVIQQLDLVISVDTSVAHLAGALGKPTWVMVPCIPDWRWQMESKDSVWYPTMRLFRNHDDVDWHKTVTEMTEELKLLVAKAPEPIDPEDGRSERALQFFWAGNQAYKDGKPQKALEYYASAAQLDNRNSELYNNLGVVLRDAGKQLAKRACYNRARTLKPEDAGIASNLANALREDGDFAEAEKLHDFALLQKPEDAGLIYNAALVHRDSGNTKKALKMLDQSLTIRPDYPDCEWDRALLLLQKGDYAEGFPAYESRWKIARAYKRTVPLPRWQGEQLNGRSIFLHDEQGFGDVMQFARFIPQLKERYGAGKVVLECQPQLMRLMTLAPGIDAVIPRERALPQCDFYIPLLSLPGIFGTTLKSLPPETPYLNAPEMAPDTAAAMPTDNRLKLGIVWAGQIMPRDRSCPLSQLLPKLGDPRFAPISLQVGDRVADLKATGADTFVTDMSPYLVDFAETAAVLSQLDLLITIDTSVAHLAGALGVPTYLLLRRTSDWRWFDDIATSPWYPSFTLFRQTNARRWNEPLEQLEQALKGFADQQLKQR